jgi:hypothetical protein
VYSTIFSQASKRTRSNIQKIVGEAQFLPKPALCKPHQGLAQATPWPRIELPSRFPVNEKRERLVPGKQLKALRGISQGHGPASVLLAVGSDEFV